MFAIVLIAAAPASAAKPRLSVADATVAEAGGTATVVVSLSKKAKRKVRVGYATADAAARAGADYTDTAGTLTIRARKRSAAIEVPVTADQADEPDEAFAVTLGGPKRAKIADGEGAVTIVDDDAPDSPPVAPDPTVSVTTASVPEGTDSNPAHSIEVRLSAASAKPIEVGYATASGTATSGTDFLAATGTLAFAPGQTSRTFDLTTVGDFDDEPDETVEVDLFLPTNVGLPATQQVVTIADDDAACVSPSTPPGTNLGSVNGDSGTGSLTDFDQISPCGDTDWFQFAVLEDSDTEKDLTARVTLQTVPNGSPSSGDIDLCVESAAAPVVEACSTASAGVTEVIEICINDPFPVGGDNSKAFLVEVKGFGNAVNSYTLDVFGNVAVTPPADINFSC